MWQSFVKFVAGELSENQILGMNKVMTIHKSLKVNSSSVKQRNVLKRAERLTKLQEMDRWNEDSSILGLPKVRVVKISLKKKKKTKKEEEGEAAAPKKK